MLHFRQNNKGFKEYDVGGLRTKYWKRIKNIQNNI